ncbi:unnamed protein product, partial [Oikopleura dioica]
LYDGPPDGGYGWWIAAGHFINIGIGYGFTKSFGIFFPYIKEEYSVDNTTTSLVFSIMMFTQYSASFPVRHLELALQQSYLSEQVAKLR